jgi:RNA polymerase sigma factor (sigma-70 family)
MDSALDRERLLAQTTWVRGLARRLVADPSLSEDLAQEALLAAWRQAPPGAGESQLRAWLTGTLRNLVRFVGRGEARRRWGEEVNARAEATESVSDAVERAELQRQVAQAVTELPEQQRAVVVWRFLDGYDYPEIARRAGCSTVAARKRVSRAVESLRVRLDAGRGGDRAAWMVALLPLARSLGTGAGVSTMNTKGMTVVATALVASLGWMWLRAESGPQPNPAAVTPAPAPTELAEPTAGADRPGLLRSEASKSPNPRPRPAAPVRLNPQPQPEADQTSGLVGRVLFDGERPTRAEVISDSVLAAWPGDPAPVDRLGRQLLVSPDGGLADVLLVLDGKPGMGPPGDNLLPIQVRVQHLRLEPHVIVARTGQPISFFNADPLAVRLVSPDPRGRPKEQLLDPGASRVLVPKGDGIAELRCADLPWTRAWLHVLDPDDWSVVSDRDGRFELPALPPGSYRVDSFHHGKRVGNHRIEVHPGTATNLNLTYRKGRIRPAR